MKWTDLDTFASFAEIERNEAKSSQASPSLMRGKMAGNVKCILRHVAALSLLAETALGAKNGDVGGGLQRPLPETPFWGFRWRRVEHPSICRRHRRHVFDPDNLFLGLSALAARQQNGSAQAEKLAFRDLPGSWLCHPMSDPLRPASLVPGAAVADRTVAGNIAEQGATHSLEAGMQIPVYIGHILQLKHPSQEPPISLGRLPAIKGVLVGCDVGRK